MALNIQNEQVHAKIRRAAGLLSEQRGQKVSQVGTIEVAIDQLLQQLERDDLVDRLMQLAHETSALMTDEFKAMDFDAELYDEAGLPK